MIICDRNFYSYQALSDIRNAGADAIFRVSASVGLPVVDVLADGSYTSVVYPPTLTSKARRAQVLAAARAGTELDPLSEGRVVRVVEYEISDRDKEALGEPAGSELIVLLTTIIEADPYADGAGASALAGAYQQRWEHEGSFKEAKVTLMEGRTVLRSRLPALAYQEIWGLLLTHYALCALAFHAAQLDPDRISLVHTLRIARRSATGTAGFPPQRWRAALPRFAAEVAADLVEPRRHRSCPRAVKRARASSFPVKKRSQPASIRYDGPATVRLYPLQPQAA